MTQAAWLLLATAAVAAALDWVAAVHRRARLRRLTKPAVMLLLIAVALALRPASPVQRDLFAAALLLSLVGDLFLLAASDRWFLAGLAAFLAAHLAYLDGFLVGGFRASLLPYSGLAVGAASLAVGGRVLGALLAGGRGTMAGPALLYLVAISGMVAVAGATGRPAAIAGAALFYASDGLIAWNRFVRPLPWATLPIMVTYHAGQALLVLSLAGS